MAIYKESSALRGKWAKGNEIKNGVKCSLVSETEPRESLFKQEDGSMKVQNVAKIHFEDSTEIFNISLNKPTINALVRAFGEDSKEWMKKTLTAESEKTKVAGKSVWPIYLIPDGYEKMDDENGYTIIVEKGSQNELPPIESI